jgi:hypothetical protein
MKKQLLALWFLMPVAAGAYHLGPGQDRMLLDDAAEKIEEAEGHARKAAILAIGNGDRAATDEWAAANVAYQEALALLPDEEVQARRRLRLERAKCRMMISELPKANAELLVLVDELVADDDADRELLRDTRHSLANSQYYMTWLTRLEGAGREEWEPRIEAARQTFKLLLEEAAEEGDEDRQRRSREDLEAAIRLARLDLTELQGLPLPSQ